MDSDPDELLRLIAALPRKQQVDLVLAILTRIALTLDSASPRPAPEATSAIPELPLDRIREVLGHSLTAPDAALLAALVHVSKPGKADVPFGTEELNEVVGNARKRLNVHALNPLCVDRYLKAVPGTGREKRFRLTTLGLAKARDVAQYYLGTGE